MWYGRKSMAVVRIQELMLVCIWSMGWNRTLSVTSPELAVVTVRRSATANIILKWKKIGTILSVLWSMPIAMIWLIIITVLGVTTMSVRLVCVYCFEVEKGYVIFVYVPSTKETDHLLPLAKVASVFSLLVSLVLRWVTSFVIILAVMVLWMILI